MLTAEVILGTKNKGRHNEICWCIICELESECKRVCLEQSFSQCGFALKEQVFENGMLGKEFRYQKAAVSVYCNNWIVCSCHLCC
jgi:hypothetical protein